MKHRNTLLAQLAFATLLVIFVPCAYLATLWSQTYLETVTLASWQKPMITDLVVSDGDCPQGYDAVTVPYRGMLEGCMCTGTAHFAMVNR